MFKSFKKLNFASGNTDPITNTSPIEEPRPKIEHLVLNSYSVRHPILNGGAKFYPIYKTEKIFTFSNGEISRYNSVIHKWEKSHYPSAERGNIIEYFTSFEEAKKFIEFKTQEELNRRNSFTEREKELLALIDKVYV